MAFLIGTENSDIFDSPSEGNDETNLFYGLGGSDRLVGASLTDTIYGGNGDDTLIGNGGNDFLYGGAGVDQISGGDGADVLSAGTGVVGATAFNLFSEPNTVNVLEGGGGADWLYGGNGADWLVGGEFLWDGTSLEADGADFLSAGAGDDFLAGGLGADTLYGGIGADVFVPGDWRYSGGNENFSTDWIGDFNPVEDRLLVMGQYDGVNGVGDVAIVRTDLAAATEDAAMVYSQASGTLFYNPNGSANGFGVTNERLVVLFGAPTLDINTNFT